MAGDWDVVDTKPAGTAKAGAWDVVETKPTSQKGAGATQKEDEGIDVPGRIGGALGVAEGLLSNVTGALAQPTKNIAGLGATAYDIATKKPGEGGDVPGFEREVEESLTYKPKTKAGREVATSNWNPMALMGKIIGGAGDITEKALMPEGKPGMIETAVPGIRRVREGFAEGAGETVRQLPNVLGAKFGPKALERAPGLPEPMQAGVRAVEKASEDAGYIRPGTGIKGAAQNLMGRINKEKDLSRMNMENATERLGTDVGIEGGQALTREVRSERIGEIIDNGYKALKKEVGPNLEVTPELHAHVEQAVKEMVADSAKRPEIRPALTVMRAFQKEIAGEPQTTPRPGIESTIESVAKEQGGPAIGRTLEEVASKQPGPKRYGEAGLSAPPMTPITTPRYATLSTDSVMRDISTLRADAKAGFIQNTPASKNLAYARLAMANELENLIEANLKDPAALQRFKVARKQLAQMYVLDRVVNDATGKVDLAKLGRLANTKAYRGVLTGEFKTAADFANTYKKAAKSVTEADEASPGYFDAMFAVGELAAGHPLAAAGLIGGRMLIPALTRRGMLQ